MPQGPSANLLFLLGLGLAGVILAARRLRRGGLGAAQRELLGAFTLRLELLPPPPPPPPKAPHPLTGLSFAVADVFHVSGYVTGFGNPEWSMTHDAATQTSAAVKNLVEGGATCVGKTVIDEMAYGLTGVNKHFGTPVNSVAPDRIPGGCSSGSAAAVAGGLVDFALGLDTIGGVRIPASFCGIFGFRPSHAVVSSDGVMPVAPSLDTVGWFAKDISILRRVGHLLLHLPYADIRQPRQIFIADDFFELSKIPWTMLTQVVTKSTEKLFGRQLLSRINLGDYLTTKLPSLKQLGNGNKNDQGKDSFLDALANTMQRLHNVEFNDHYKEWIDSNRPSLDPCIQNILVDNDAANIDECQAVRRVARMALSDLLKDDGILVVPTVFGLPPKISNTRELSSKSYSTRVLYPSSIASISGCCQVTVPLGTVEKCPVSVSFIGRHGADRFLLDTVHTMYNTFCEQLEVAKSSESTKGNSNEEYAENAKEKGNAAFKEKQWQKAANYYTEAIRLNGKVATYYSNRAAAYLEMTNYHQAETDCSNAISIDPKSVKAYLRRGTAREMMGFYKEATEDFSYALVLEPTNKTASSAIQRLKNLFP